MIMKVPGGVESVNFNEDRFVGIITTNENLDRLKRCFDDNKLNPNKVFTHDQFLEYCKNKFMVGQKDS